MYEKRFRPKDHIEIVDMIQNNHSSSPEIKVPEPGCDCWSVINDVHTHAGDYSRTLEHRSNN